MWSHIFTFLSGAAVLALAQLVAPTIASEVLRQFQAKSAARRVVGLQLDPMLKAADELQGKLLSLAKEDFTEFRRLTVEARTSSHDSVNLCSTLYLFAQLWARFEILRLASFHAELMGDRRGATMLKFVHSLESRQIRLVDRAWQRAIGESLIVGGQSAMEIRSFRDFVEQYQSSPGMRRWFEPLANMLCGTHDKKVRQRVLRYGVVVHAMIDTLDPKHHTTKPRPGYPNKLSRRSRHDLIGRVFGIYLPNVRSVGKYTVVAKR